MLSGGFWDVSRTTGNVTRKRRFGATSCCDWLCFWEVAGGNFVGFRLNTSSGQQTSRIKNFKMFLYKLKPVSLAAFLSLGRMWTFACFFFSGWISGCFSRFTQTPSFLKYVSRFFGVPVILILSNSCWTPPDQEIRLCTADRDKTKKALDALKRRKVGAPWSAAAGMMWWVVMLSSGWWFQMIFYVQPYLGNWCNLTNIFPMGWHHQLVMFFLLRCLLWLVVFFGSKKLEKCEQKDVSLE